MTNNTRRAGFTLLEIVIAISILAMMMGMLGPMTAAMINRGKYDATVERVNAIGDAVYMYVEDTLKAPAAMKDIAADPGVAGWAGPYLTDGYVADANGIAEFELDAFRNKMVLKVVDVNTVTITSTGVNTSDSADDISRTINLAPIRRDVSKKNIDIVNAAILAFNKALEEGDQTLSASVTTAFSQLTNAGLLPDDQAIILDGWGDTLIGDPDGKSPLVAVASKNLGGTPAAGGGGSSSGGGSSGGGPGGWGSKSKSEPKDKKSKSKSEPKGKAKAKGKK